MNSSKWQDAKRKQFRFPVEALFISAIISTNALASTGPSWSSQPSWTNGSSGSDNSSPPATKSRYHEYVNSNISPYSPGSNNLALDVGQVFLMGDLSRFSDSIGSQLHYTYGVSDLFGFDSSIGYSEHSNTAQNMSMFSFLTGLRTNLAWYDKVVPYFVFGVGFYRPDYEVQPSASLPNGNSLAPLLFGIHVGPGVDLALTKQIFFGAALTLHDVFGTTRTAADGTQVGVGGTYASFMMHAGVTF